MERNRYRESRGRKMVINGEYFKNEKEYLEHMKKIHKLCEEIIKKEEVEEER